jgi:hypothetical protein
MENAVMQVPLNFHAEGAATAINSVRQKTTTRRCVLASSPVC